jgi:hypothetical protein
MRSIGVLTQERRSEGRLCHPGYCAVAEWRAVVIGSVLAFVVLVFGAPFEKWVRTRRPSPTDDGSG